MAIRRNDPTAAAAQIRFSLEQLSSKNGHHDFEHLCRHLARARITKLIIPATGPVSAGGDQGCDFETIPTVESASTELYAWRELKDGGIAFACTLTKTPHLLSKVKADITTIKANENAIRSVHYFTSADVPKAKRKKLITWAKEAHKIQLVIYDGQAISEWLADPDVIWIAERYLATPVGLLKFNKLDTDALCDVESNVVDACFFDAPLQYRVRLTNRSEVDWLDITLSAWAMPFASEDPIANPVFQQLTYRRFDVIPRGAGINVDVSDELRHLCQRDPMLKQIVLRPFQCLDTYKASLNQGNKISFSCSAAQMPVELLQQVKTVLSTDRARMLFSSRAHMRAGVLVVLVLGGGVGQDGRMGRFVKVLPFVNTWLGMCAPARTASDVYFVNAPIPVAHELLDGKWTESDTRVSYSLQHSTQLSDTVAAQGAMLRIPTVTGTSANGESVTAHTFVIIGHPDLRFFDAGIRPNNAPGEETQLESPFHH